MRDKARQKENSSHWALDIGLMSKILPRQGRWEQHFAKPKTNNFIFRDFVIYIYIYIYMIDVVNEHHHDTSVVHGMENAYSVVKNEQPLL